MLQVCDVDADGECFYRCFVACAEEDEALWTMLFRPSFSQAQAISCLRRRVAKHVCENDEAREWIRSLILMHKDTGSIVEEHPLLQNASSLNDVYKNVTVHRVWASQVEYEVVQRFAKWANIALIIVEGTTTSAANQLLAAVDKVRCARCIVFVRIDDCHYQYLRVDKRQVHKIFNTAWLIYAAAQLAMLEDADDQLF